MSPETEDMIQSGLVRRLGASLRLVIIGGLLLVGLLGIFFVLIVRAADERSRVLLTTELDRATSTVAEALRPVLRNATPGDVMLIAGALEVYASSDRVLGLFFTPAEGQSGVYVIAGAPVRDFAGVERESARLVNSGAFGEMSAACAPVRIDRAALGDTSLWAVVPIASPAGCWRLVATRTLTSAGPTFLALPAVRGFGLAAAAGALLMIVAALFALAQLRRLRRIVDVGLAYAEIATVDDAALLPRPANDEVPTSPSLRR